MRHLNTTIMAALALGGIGMIARETGTTVEIKPAPEPEPLQPVPEEKPKSGGINRIEFEGDKPKSVQLKETKRRLGSHVTYLPHQGDREVQRRLKQEAKRLAKQTKA